MNQTTVAALGREPDSSRESAIGALPSAATHGSQSRSSFLLVSLVCAAMLCTASAASPADEGQMPFLRLREAKLQYTGPQDELTNLTEIRIGWFGPSDTTNHVAGDQWWAASLALREANAQGGLRGLPFGLIPRWSVDPWGTGVSQLTRMVYEEQPLALLGSVDSATTHLAEQVVAKARLPLVSAVSTDNSVTLAGVSWMFSCAPSDAAIARPLVQDILATLKTAGDKLALLVCTDHESRMTTREVLKEFSRRGRLPDFRFDVPPGAHAVAQQMSALEEARPATVLIIAGAEDAARLTRAVRDRLGHAAIFGGQSMSRRRFVELAGPAAEGVRFPLLFVPNLADDTCRRFVNRYTTEHQRAPDYTAALAYDATRLLIDAIRQAGPSRARVREALARLSPWAGVAGPIEFDGTGQNTRANLCLGTIHNGAVIPLDATPALNETVKQAKHL